MRPLLAALLVCAAPPLGLSAQQSVAAPPAQPATPCMSATPHRQFDFWIGTWDVYPSAAPAGRAPRIGVNVITAIESGCALLESWTATRGGTGRSLNWYDTNLQTWRQLWIDQQGNTLDYTSGEYRDGAMRFTGWTRGPAGERVEQRLIFFNIHRDTVRQLFEASRDSGRTWQPTFDGRYVRRAVAP
jgi:hypothetical protein